MKKAFLLELESLSMLSRTAATSVQRDLLSLLVVAFSYKIPETTRNSPCHGSAIAA
jgi:hypothetical protein